LGHLRKEVGIGAESMIYGRLQAGTICSLIRNHSEEALSEKAATPNPDNIDLRFVFV
jgi:hypothetical protein